MTLDELRTVIADSAPEDWHELGGGGTFLSDFMEGSEGGEWRLLHDGHAERAVLKHNLDVGLAWGLTWHKDFSEPWTKHFPDDSPGKGHYADVLWRGAPVIREAYVVVDGGRYALPLPKQNYEEIAADKHVQLPYTVTPWQRDVIRIVHALSATYDFDEGLSHARIQIEG